MTRSRLVTLGISCISVGMFAIVLAVSTFRSSDNLTKESQAVFVLYLDFLVCLVLVGFTFTWLGVAKEELERGGIQR